VGGGTGTSCEHVGEALRRVLVGRALSRRGYLAEMRGTLVKPANGGVRRGGRCGPKQGVVDRPPKECAARGADRRRGPGRRWPLLRWLPDGSGKRAWWKHVVTIVDWGDRHLDKWAAKRES
jgi:hypothetical protein